MMKPSQADVQQQREKIAAASERAGKSFKEISKAIGANDAYIQQFVTYGKPQKGLDTDVSTAIELFLGLTPGELQLPKRAVGKTSSVSSPIAQPAQSVPNITDELRGKRETTLPSLSSTRADAVEVYGVVVGGADAEFRLEHTPVDYVRRLPGIMNSRRVFAFFLHGDSMEPAFDDGALIFCDPSRRVVPNDYVVIELRPKHEGDPPGCLLKRLVRRSADKIRVKQYNPPTEFDISMKDVISVTHVLTLKELAGS
jgi:phage repressor protein C with HTH and peptisase S24 domain